MSRRLEDPLLVCVESFFAEYLRRIRDASRHTIVSYRDTLRLFFSFLADRRRVTVAALRIDDMSVEGIGAFLKYLEDHRHNSVATRNLRLRALRSFVKHLLRRDPSHAAQYQRILSLPAKTRSSPALTTYLEPEEMRVLLDQPDRRRRDGARDYALLLFLYNTGARISEALGVRRSDLDLERPRQVHLHGKGRRDRICPLWPATGAALRGLAVDLPRHDLIFMSARRQPLTRDGAAYLLHKYVERAATVLPSIGKKRVTPHVLRHSCAVALLQAGVDLTVIRDYLGHQRVDTTGRYARSNLRMKRKVLEAFWKRAPLGSPRQTRWRPDGDLLAFLSSL